MSSLCRACLTGNLQMYCLENNILEIYEKLTNIKLCARGPPLVCYFCHSLLQRCRKFSEMAHYSENMLQDLHDKGIEASHNTILQNPINYYNHLSQSSVLITDVNGMDVIEKSYDPIVPEKQELEVEFVGVKEEIIKAEVDVGLVLTESTDTNEENGIASCDTFNSNTFIEETILPTSSDTCERYVEKNTPLYHIETNNQITYNCDTCDKVWLSKRSVYRHNCPALNREPYACIKCHKTFNSNDALTGHMQVHSKEKFKCHICNKIYSTKSYLAAHVKIHSAMPSQCNICHKSMFKKVHLKRLAYTCDICKKRFLSESFLKKHMRSHPNSLQTPGPLSKSGTFFIFQRCACASSDNNNKRAA